MPSQVRPHAQNRRPVHFELRGTLLSDSPPPQNSAEEIIAILKSQQSVKNIRIRVKASFFGVSWAASQDQANFIGTIDRWYSAEHTILMVKWEGWARCRQAELTTLDKDSDGESIELELLPYDDGRPPPTLVEEEDEEEEDDDAAGAADGGDGFDDDEMEDMVVEDTVTITCAQPMKPLGIKELEWKKEAPTGINLDARTADRSKPTLNAQYALNDIESIFHYLLPEGWIELQLKHTNPKLSGIDQLNAKLTKGTLLRFWGYALALSIHTGLSLEQMWSDRQDDESILPPPAMGRHGMTYARFKKIRGAIAFGPGDEASLRADNWAFVRGLIDLYNKSREEQVTAGWLITGDETMVAWRGQSGVLNVMKCPHLSWVPRKPEPLGVELKTVGDALSGIMLRIEICEGKEPMRAKKYSAEYGATTACTMRLFEPWFGSGRVAAADSWFAGVKTAWALLDNGLHFIGDVKTNSSLFVKEALVAATAGASGAWATYSSMLTISNDKEIPIYSVSHRRGEAVHTFIATCGTTLRGNSTKAYFADDEERASGQEFELFRQAPRVLNDFTVAQPCLDRHNRYRQFILAMEKRILTNSFSTRFGTAMHGIVFTDCFFAYRYFVDSGADFKAIMGKLAHKLMHNSFLDSGESPRKSPSSGRDSTGTCSPCGGGGEHNLIPLRSVPGYAGGRQQRCIGCNRKTSFVCGGCTTSPFALVPLCPCETKVKKDSGRVKKGQIIKHACLGRHRENPALRPGSRGRKAKRARAAATDGTGSVAGSEDEGEGAEDENEQFDDEDEGEEDEE